MAIVLETIDKSYHGIKVVDQVSLEIAKGQFTALWSFMILILLQFMLTKLLQ